MNGRERVQHAFQRQALDRAPWVPFVGCHAGALLDLKASDYLQSADHLVRGVDEAVRRYRPDGLPVIFDLQIEAEIFGCDLLWADENPPAVTSHPLADGKSLDDIAMPTAETGRMPAILDATRRIRAAHPDLAVYGLITGPFTLALHLMGTDIFMAMFTDPDRVHKVMAFARDVACRMADFYLDAGCDVIAVVDPMTSQISPDQFVPFVTPHIKPVFDHVRERGALSSFFVCGHAQQNIEVMCDCGPDNVSVDENIPLEYVRDICLARKVSFGGNLQLTTVLLLGSELDAQRNAIACLEIGGDEGFVLSPGCDLPFATPPANLEAVAQVAIDPYQRDVVKSMAVEETTCDRMDMAEYGQSNKVVVDIITLDSEACAPCQYMVESVKAITPQFEGLVEWREHKIKYRESLVFMTSLMVHNIPTICIDGRITFVSRIPSQDELIEAIQHRLVEKLRMKIQRKRASLRILGDPESEAFQAVRANIERATKELSHEVDILEVSGDERIMSFGVHPQQTPAVILARYELKSTHGVPEVAVVKEWIKSAY